MQFNPSNFQSDPWTHAYINFRFGSILEIMNKTYKIIFYFLNSKLLNSEILLKKMYIISGIESDIYTYIVITFCFFRWSQLA